VPLNFNKFERVPVRVLLCELYEMRVSDPIAAIIPNPNS
jgi:hypothetical protein